MLWVPHLIDFYGHVIKPGTHQHMPGTYVCAGFLKLLVFMKCVCLSGCFLCMMCVCVCVSTPKAIKTHNSELRGQEKIAVCDD